jgi:methionine-rich copper-binding protein CopC
VKLRFAFVAGVIAALFIGITAVLGHADLESSDPAAGATITTPYTLTATFSEEMAPDESSIVVQDSTGKEVARGSVSATDDKQMTVDLPALPDGEYEVLWTTVTADDNGVERGTYNFTVAAAAATPAPTTAPTTAASASATTPAVTAAATPAPTPSASASPGSTTGSGADLLLPIALVVVIVAAIAGYFVYRSRRPPAA